MTIYQVRLKEMRDRKNTLDYAREMGVEEGLEKGIQKGLLEGKIEGRVEGRIEGQKHERLAIAASLKAEGMPYELILKVTGLSKEEIAGLE